MDWHDRDFQGLTGAEVYALLALRQRVFVIEQQCIYLDADGADPRCRHVFATRDGSPQAYLRVIPPGLAFAEASIGRVLTAPSARGTGLGRELMHRGHACVRAHHGDVAIRIAAQAHLTAFYGSLGYAVRGEPFDEDGIRHVYMLRARGPHG